MADDNQRLKALEDFTWSMSANAVGSVSGVLLLVWVAPIECVLSGFGLSFVLWSITDYWTYMKAKHQ